MYNLYNLIIVLINVLVNDLNTTPITHHLLHPDRHYLIIFIIVLFYLVLFLGVWIAAIIAGYAEEVH